MTGACLTFVEPRLTAAAPPMRGGKRLGSRRTNYTRVDQTHAQAVVHADSWRRRNSSNRNV
jgi:hypothetical protein